jgi:hypothetical protein
VTTNKLPKKKYEEEQKDEERTVVCVVHVTIGRGSAASCNAYAYVNNVLTHGRTPRATSFVADPNVQTCLGRRTCLLPCNSVLSRSNFC